MIMPIVYQQSAYGDSTSSNSVNLSKNGNSGDPQIAVSGNNLYVVWISWLREGTGIFLSKSTDGGTSFSDPVNVSNTGSKPRIAVSGNNVYIVWDDESTGRANVFFSRSTDGGKTFDSAISVSKDIKFSEITRSIEPQITVSGNNVYVSWVVYDYSWSAIFFAKSTDSGKTFSAPKNLSKNNEGSAGNPEMATTGNTIYITWLLYQTAKSGRYEGGSYQDVYFAVSKDAGSSFNKPIILTNHDAASPTQDVALSDNNFYVVWFHSLAFESGTPLNSGMFLATSSDHGTSFRDVINLSDSKSWGSGLPRISASDNNVYVVWQTIHGAYGVFFVTSIDGGKTFSKPINLNPITRQVSPYESAAVASVASSGNNVFVAWRDASPDGNFETFLAASNNRGFTFGKVINLSNNAGDTASDPQIAVSGDNVYLVWTDSIPAASDVFFTAVSVRELTLKTTDKVGTLPELPTLEGYNFEIWSHPWENSMYGLSVSVYGKICGEPVPPEGSQLMLEHHYTRPDGSEIIMMPGSSGWVYTMEPRVWCNTIAVGGDYLNMTGTWNVYVVAKWPSEDVMQEVRSNTVNIVVNKPVFTSDKIEKISVEKIAEVSHANGSAPWFSLLDWSPNGDFIVITYHDYSEQRDTLGGSLAIMSPDAEEVKKIVLPIKFESIITARISPSNDHILIGGSYYKDDNSRTGLFVYNIQTGTITQITNGSDYQYSGYADWTAGENIVYVDRVFDEITHESEGTTIWLVDPDGSKRVLYTGSEQLGEMDVSPDGRRIVFVKPLYPFKPTSELTVFDMEKKEFRTVLESDGLASPRWSPNSELIIYNVYGTSKPGGSTLKIASVDGTLKEYLYGGVYNAPHNSLVSPDGSFILFDLDNNQLAKMELMKPIPEFPINLMAITAIGLIGVLVAIRFKK